jgi:hypothetical protein
MSHASEEQISAAKARLGQRQASYASYDASAMTRAKQQPADDDFSIFFSNSNRATSETTAVAPLPTQPQTQAPAKVNLFDMLAGDHNKPKQQAQPDFLSNMF